MLVVDFDTGSSDLFLPGPDCGSTCSGHTTYDPSSSSTSKDVGKSFSLAYGDGSTVSGEQYTDTVSIAGLTVCLFPPIAYNQPLNLCLPIGYIPDPRRCIPLLHWLRKLSVPRGRPARNGFQVYL